MRFAKTSRRRSSLVGVLALLGTICVVAGGLLDGDGRITIESKAEEIETRAEHDDGEQLCAVIAVADSPHPGSHFGELILTADDSPLLSHTWRWCSRGPPVV